MDDMKYAKGDRVTYTDPSSGDTFDASVEANSRGWVMLRLDEPRDTPGGWQASMMMVKAITVAPAGQ